MAGESRYVRQMKTTGICVSHHATMLASDSTTRREMAPNSRASSQQIRIGRCMRKGWQTEEMPADNAIRARNESKSTNARVHLCSPKQFNRESRHLLLPQSPTTLRRHCGFCIGIRCTHAHYDYCRRQLHVRSYGNDQVIYDYYCRMTAARNKTWNCNWRLQSIVIDVQSSIRCAASHTSPLALLLHATCILHSMALPAQSTASTATRVVGFYYANSRSYLHRIQATNARAHIRARQQRFRITAEEQTECGSTSIDHIQKVNLSFS